MFHNYPYTDFHEMNLDWFINKFKELVNEWEGISGNLRGWLEDQLQEWLDNGTIEKYLNNLVVVNDYGAKGDGVNDDTEAIQRCIDENPNALICFKEGIYNISDTIELWGASGGQYVLFGGATIKWVGPVSLTTPMILVEKDMEPVVSSMCRIVGGNFDGNNLAGVCIQNKAFYTEITGSKLFDFTNYGILNGTHENDVNKSTQSKIHDIHIFMRDDNEWSAEDRTAMKFTYPDNQISDVVTNRCKYAYELVSGGNSFVNCHSTVQYQADYQVTEDNFTGGHIFLNPKNSGLVQENIFTNCYFNVGKYVVYNPYISTNLVTRINDSHYTYYRSADLPFTLEAFLWYGHYGVLKTDNFDIIVGANCNFRDYWVSGSTPTAVGIPEMNFNTSIRHPEADICVANNYMNENSPMHILAGNTLSIPAADTYYEVGGVVFSYVTSEDFQRIYSEPIKVEYSVEFTRCEAIINLSDDNDVIVNTTECMDAVNVHRLYVGEITDKIIGGKTYKYLPFYIYCTGYLSLRLFLKIYTMGTNTKAYVVNRVAGEHAVSEPNATRLFERSIVSVPDNLNINSFVLDSKYLITTAFRNISAGQTRTLSMVSHAAVIAIKRGGIAVLLLADEYSNTPIVVGGTLPDSIVITQSGKDITITNNYQYTIYVSGLA